MDWYSTLSMALRGINLAIRLKRSIGSKSKEASATITAKPLPISTVAYGSNSTTRPKTCKPKTNDNRGGAFNFTTQNNAVFKGQATVVNGAFTFEFRVPLDINLSVGPPKIAAYATNFERDFWGASRQHLIGGVYDGVITDNEGPEVRLYINDTNFVSGGFSDPDPTALGFLYDESGINAGWIGNWAQLKPHLRRPTGQR